MLRSLERISFFGQFVRGNTETCKKGASCLYASAKFSPLVTVEITSCSRVRCKAIGRNNCGNITIKGVNKRGFIENVAEKFSKMKEIWKIVIGSG
ncbi:hypothetical protein PRIPAC_95719 [Pristionchus pacificus]|uniref:Uncharacterized protein n=1 Tax=Pristionchus pacificus TaxID=54126 RepID=A0A2A6BBT2_PRIPA|nr:hypothetical protein PRIPAC_95719 [Pristionchus pacificus]|eukprot:PDM63352.1 hypothetical protein PRIPAC_53709 [Pristionchus pacificus]